MSLSEKPYYYITTKIYKGSFPSFYDSNNQVAAQIIKDNYEVIKSEITEYYREHNDRMEPNFTPYKYAEKGWKTLNLISYFIKYEDACNSFPETYKVLKKIPYLSGAQISVLTPQTRIKAHTGDTNVIIRNHLGIVIPGKHPDIGFRIKNKEVCWEEGNTISFNIAHRHYAWNYSDHFRIIFQVDVFRAEYWRRRFSIAGKILGSITTKLIATKYKRLKNLPFWLTFVAHRIISLGYTILLLLQEYFGLRIEKIFAISRKKKIKKG